MITKESNNEIQSNEDTKLDIKKIDHSYKPFPSFSEWAKCSIDEKRWKIYTDTHNEKIKNLNITTLKRAQKIVSRVAAIESGAIEGLYETDRGFTFTVATEAAMWESALSGKGDKTFGLIKQQLHAYEYVLDFATQKIPIVEAWIRQLHQELCKAQKTYFVQTAVGPQEQELPIGEYKSLPNHVMQSDGKIHAYSPVDSTPAEMHRLCAQISSEEFQTAHPILQSSYAHYSFVAIHPFADGNGRVARALGSVFTYRSYSFPLLILADNRRHYYKALSESDQGNYQEFVNFILARCIDAITLIDESILAAGLPEISDLTQAVKSLYLTSGGYTHKSIDKAGNDLLELLASNFQEIIREQAEVKEVRFNISVSSRNYPPARQHFRHMIDLGARYISLNLNSSAPADATMDIQIGVSVPKDGAFDDDIVLNDLSGKEIFSARLSDLIPEPNTSIQMKMKIFSRRIVAQATSDLLKKATMSLQSKGYR